MSGRLEKFPPVCTNNEARAYFTEKGLTYDDITDGQILALVLLLNEEIKRSNKTGETSVSTMSLSRVVKSKHKSNGSITECYLFNPGTWSYGNVEATFSNFNYSSDGWVNDDDGITVLRVAGDARVTIPYQAFATDFRTTGKTIEVEFATRDVMNYDSVIMSCMSGGRGSIIGTVLGMLIIAVMNNLLNLIGVPPFLREAFKGLIVIVAVLLQKKDKQS